MTDVASKEQKLSAEENISSKILTIYLIWSVIISVSIIIVGTILFIVTGKSGYNMENLNSLITAKGSLSTYPFYIQSIWSGVLTLKPFAIIQLGVLILLLTPFGRMLLQVFIFLYEKDTTFAIIALVVFAILLFSLYMVNILEALHIA